MDALLMASEAQAVRINAHYWLRIPLSEGGTTNCVFVDRQPAGPYESATMNRKLAAAKQWLAEHY